MLHSSGDPQLALGLDAIRAAAATAFHYFIIGVPSAEEGNKLAARLT
jgi:hypothetical protein